MHGGDARRFKLRRHAQIEIGRVNAHKHGRADLLQPRHQLAADF